MLDFAATRRVRKATELKSLRNRLAYHNSREIGCYTKDAGIGGCAHVRVASGWGSAMREILERETPDTEPYQEWLAVIGSIIVVAVGLTVLLSQGVLS